MFHRRRERFKFTEKTHSKKGIISLIAAGVLLVCYFVFVALAFQRNGALSAYYGSAGVFAMLFSVVNLVFAIQSMFEEDSFQLFPRLSFAVSLLALICWIATYAVGFLA